MGSRLDLDGIWIYPRNPMDTHGIAWISMGSHGYLRKSMNLHGTALVSIPAEFHEYPWEFGVVKISRFKTNERMSKNRCFA